MSTNTPADKPSARALAKARLYLDDLKLNHEEWIVCGRFGRPHGVRGEVRLWSYNNHTELLEDGMNLFIGPHPKHPSAKVKPATHRLTLTKFRMDSKGLLTGFKELNSREDAQELNHLAWLTPRSHLPDLEEDEFYLVDLIGAEGWALDPQNDTDLANAKFIGKLTGMLEAGAGDLFIFESKEYGELTIPNQDPFVISIDMEQKRVLVRAIPGLLEGGI